MAIPFVLTAAMDAFFGKATSGFVILRSLASGAFEKFNPAGAMIVQRNIDNLTAALGGLLAPAMEIFNDALILANEYITGLTPHLQALFEPFVRGFRAAEPLFQKLMTLGIGLVSAWTQVIGALFSIYGTLFKIVGFKGGIETLGDVVEFVGKILIGVAMTIKEVYVQINSLLSTGHIDSLGKMWENIRKNTIDIWNRASVARGITQAAYKSEFMSFEEFAKKAYEASFGSGTRISPEQFYDESLKKQDETNRLLGNIDKNTGLDEAKARLKLPAPGGADAIAKD